VTVQKTTRQRDPAEHHRHGRREPPARAFAERRPRQHRDDDDLHVHQDGRDPRADLVDRGAPQHQVDAQERARQQIGPAPLVGSEPPPLPYAQRDQHGQRQHAPVEARRPGRGARELDEHRRHRDAHGTRDHQEPWVDLLHVIHGGWQDQ